MPEKMVYDQYKEMVEKTKKLHSELVELSSKVDCMVISMNAGMVGSVVSSQNVPVSGLDVKVSSDQDKYGNSSLKRPGSSIGKY
ncbi:hypothetical protein [Methanococcoides sp. FTZ1]|uniref:hypothetical protein n=1 Tax=Methanococcoides sp. FTZ1 TaxID=3439061 RepID=UPI003F83658B